MLIHIVNLLKCLFGLHAWHFVRGPEGWEDKCQHCDLGRLEK